MKIFLTGGTGYIGENLAIALRLKNHEVFALVRSLEKGATLAAAGVHLIQGDLDNKEAIEQGMKGCDVVFHLAAFARVWPDKESLYKNINVDGTRHILDSAKKNEVKKVIVTSTAGVYGPSSYQNATVDEETIRSTPYFNFYESTKAEAEEIIKEFSKNGLHVVIVNPTRVYGPGKNSESNAVTKLIELYLKGKWRFIPGDGRRIGNYCYIDDIVDGHIKAWEYGRSGENYLLGGENSSYQHFFNLLKEVSGNNKKLVKIPVFVLKLVSYLMLLGAHLFKITPLITPKWVKKYMYDWSISSKKAIDELGYSITPLEEGIKKTIDWIQNTEENKKYTLITGSSLGIGKAMAEECAKRRLNLILVALPGTGLGEVCETLKKNYHVDVIFLELNLIEPGAIQQLYNWCEIQKLDINMLVNNAGIGDCSYFETTDLEFYLNMMNINAQTVVSLTRIFFPKLRMHKKAYILNTGSFAALMPLPFKSVYSATKSFVLAFSRSLNMELKEFGIHVSCVCPGPTKTENIRLRYQLDGQSSNFFIMEPEVVAKLAIDGLFNHKELIVPGWKNRLLLTCGSFVPLAIKHYILKSIFRKEVKYNGAIQNEVIGSEIKQSVSVQNGVIPKATMQSGEIINGKNHISDSFLIKGSGFSNPLQKLN